MQHYLVNTISEGGLRRELMMETGGGQWFEWTGWRFNKPAWRRINNWAHENKTLKFKEINLNQVNFYKAIL